MLQNKNAESNVAVRDLSVARGFYQDKLGLIPTVENAEVIVFRSGHSNINVYRSEYAGTNKATAVTWSVGDEIDRIMQELRAKGVSFEHYDMPGMKRDGDIHVADGIKVAWFKDPDGNILNLISG